MSDGRRKEEEDVGSGEKPHSLLDLTLEPELEFQTHSLLVAEKMEQGVGTLLCTNGAEPKGEGKPVGGINEDESNVNLAGDKYESLSDVEAPGAEDTEDKVVEDSEAMRTQQQAGSTSLRERPPFSTIRETMDWIIGWVAGECSTKNYRFFGPNRRGYTIE